jgi:hypothetical protein
MKTHKTDLGFDWITDDLVPPNEIYYFDKSKIKRVINLDTNEEMIVLEK